MTDPAKACLFIPPELKRFKLDLFQRIARHIQGYGGSFIHGDFAAVGQLPDDVVPIVGCTPELRPTIDRWIKSGRKFVYWDRGYNRRIFATDLPVGANGGMYRWHVGSFQMTSIRDVPDDRWRATKTDIWPWSKGGRHIVVAEPPPTYQRFHGIEGWTERTLKTLRQITDRQIVVRDKEMQRFGRKLHEDLRGAHCLVTHASNAAVEAIIMGCPVVVDRSSAAALVGLTDLNKIETPVYPEREPWCRSLSYSQFSEAELIDGTLWHLIS